MGDADECEHCAYAWRRWQEAERRASEQQARRLALEEELEACLKDFTTRPVVVRYIQLPAPKPMPMPALPKPRPIIKRYPHWYERHPGFFGRIGDFLDKLWGSNAENGA